jgi:predicted transcriptional regulator
MWMRSSRSVRPARYWMSVLNGGRLREARVARGLSRGELAAVAKVSVSTMARLEAQVPN